MIIRFAENKDIPALKNIWRECFGDTDTFINKCFENFFKEKSVILVEEDGKIISNLHIMPYRTHFMGKELNTAYIYAVATLKEYRGKKYAHCLIEETLKFIENSGYDASFLIAAIDNYYERFGFLTLDKGKNEILSSEEEKTHLEDASFSDIYKIYYSLVSCKEVYFSHNVRDIKLLLSDFLSTPDFYIKKLDNLGYVFYREDKDKILIYEIMAKNKETEDKIISSLSSLKPVKYKRMPVMFKFFKKCDLLSVPDIDKIYLNLVMWN